MTFALFVSATTLSQAAGEESRKRVILRRALRGLHAAQDIGLVLGSLLLGLIIIIWEEDTTPPFQTTNLIVNSTDQFFVEEDYEVRFCM